MKTTLKNMQLLITDKERKYSNEELAKLFYDTENPIYFAALYEKMFKRMIQISNKFYSISQDDLASISLEILNKSINNFDIENSNFNTFFSTYFKNALGNEVRSILSYKRKPQKDSISLQNKIKDSNYELDYQQSLIHNKAFDDIDNIMLMSLIDNSRLNNIEKKYCKKTILEPHKQFNTEISKQLNITQPQGFKIKESIKEKIKRNVLVLT